MANGVTTEWEDIHVKLGNFVPREKVPTMEETSKATMEKAEDYDPLANKKLKELDELEDDLDNKYLEEYRKKRMEEIKAVTKKNQFGQLMEICKSEYITEVTNAPKDVFVIISLYQSYVTESLLVNKYLEKIAEKHPDVKFIKMVATKCIETFPDDNCPAMIIYRNGAVFKQLIPLKHFVLLRDLTCKGIDISLYVS